VADVTEDRLQWLETLEVGDLVMQVHDSGNYAPQQFTVYSVTNYLIRIQRLTTVRRYRRRDGREDGGFCWHIEPVVESATTS
jgi:hypothetical protein